VIRPGLTRRTALKLGAAAAGLPLLRPWTAFAAGRTHGLSLFGDLKYGPGFEYFDYVRADAPKGGRIVFTPSQSSFNQSFLTFNTLNGFVMKGDAPPNVGLTLTALMVRAVDEPDAVYGLAAEGAQLSDDGNELRFFLRSGPRFHDGSPLTAQDVAWSFTTLKEKGHPDLRLPLAEMASAEAVGDAEVVVRFTGRQSRELKLLVAALPIFSKAFYASRDFEASTREPPLGSGPYRIGNFEFGRFIEYERVPDWWGADLNVARGQNNFEVVRLEFFRERQAGFEAFKKGDVTFREEFTSKTWATEYDFPAAADGRVIKTLVPDERLPDFQAWYFNMRRPKFADPRTRRALGLAFDFEWLNQNLFYGSYRRANSFFEKSPFAAAGEASPAEIALLEPFRDRLPEGVFSEPLSWPASDGTGHDRKRLSEAARLLGEAGWRREGNRLVSGAGEPLDVEFLIQNDPTSERVLGKYVEALRSIGVGATIRQVDSTQLQARLNDFDYDVMNVRLRSGATPLEELRSAFTSQSADTPGSRNYAGIKDPVVDALVEAALAAPTREAHQTVITALDRVLRANVYAVPQWVQDNHRLAHWDAFGWPEMKPDYDFPFEATWWFDRAKAARAGVAG